MEPLASLSLRVRSCPLAFLYLLMRSCLPASLPSHLTGKLVSLGYFATAEEAAREYARAKKEKQSLPAEQPAEPRPGGGGGTAEGGTRFASPRWPPSPRSDATPLQQLLQADAVVGQPSRHDQPADGAVAADGADVLVAALPLRAPLEGPRTTATPELAYIVVSIDGDAEPGAS